LITCRSKKCGQELIKSHYLKNKYWCCNCEKWIKDPNAIKEEEIESLEKDIETTKEEEFHSCEFHPKYGGIRKPRTDCSICWQVYLTKQRQKVT